MISIPKELAKQMLEDFRKLILVSRTNSNGKVWTSCLLCSGSNTNGEPIRHSSKCGGKDYINALEKALKNV